MQYSRVALDSARGSYRRLTIHARLILVVLATALPLTAFAAVLVLWHSRIEQDLLREDASRTAAVAMQAIDREVSGAVTGLQVLAASPSLAMQDFRAFQAQARSAVGIAGNSVIILYDRQGNRIMSTAVEYGRPLPRRLDMSPMARPFETGKPYVSPLFISATVNQPTLGIIVPVIVQGEVKYVLGAGLLSSRLSELTMKSGLPPDWVAAVLDQQGTIIGRTRKAAEFVGTKALPQVWARIQAVRAPAGTVDALTKEGEHALLAFARSDTSGWTTAVAIPAEALGGQLFRSLSLLAGAALAVLLLATALASRALGHITRPVTQLLGAAGALEAGREVPPLSTGIEQFDQLATAMQHAGLAIREREAKLAEHVEQLREAHRDLSSEHAKKDQFIATLAHELRNPLAPVRTGVQVLSRNPPPHVATRTLTLMDRQLSHMVRLIDDLLDVSRIARGTLVLRREPTDLRQVVSDAVESTAEFVPGSGQHLVLEAPEHPLCVDADAARIRQVVTNLIHNAAKFGRDGRIRVCLSSAESAAEIRVSDDGVGIPPEDIERIFELFYQVPDANHTASSGLGIGLSLSRRVIELHGGTLTASSEGRGRGATFVVKLPSTVAPAAASANVVPLHGSPVTRVRRVLVVDDNEDAAETLAGLMRLVGHSVQVAHDGPSALDLAAQSQFDVILLDIGMPNMNGHEVCRRLRQMPGCQGTKVVALTGWGTESDREQTRQAGFDGHLTKPADWSDIEAVL
jgi:signal transduction histidine kinase